MENMHADVRALKIVFSLSYFPVATLEMNMDIFFITSISPIIFQYILF